MGVVVVAAGMGTRLGAGMPKALVSVAGAPLVVHALRRASAARGVRHIIVVVPLSHRAEFDQVLRDHRLDPTIVEGGAERTDSVAAGIRAIPDDVDVVLVHDAARAFAPTALFDAVTAAIEAGADAVVPGLPVTDTIKQVDETGHVVATPDRSRLRAVQTPQGFRRAALDRAHAHGRHATDDAALVEADGAQVIVVDGHPDALKVTVPADLDLVSRLAQPEPPVSRSNQ